jgi:DNA-binding MarR family transcriptional regulator
MPSNKNLLQESNSNIQLSADSDLKPKITIGFQLAKILKLKRRFIDIEMKELGLSRTGWQVLFWLTILAPCSQKELLKNLDIDAGHLARVLEEFEQKKYIVRSQIEGDRRSLLIQITQYSQQNLIPHMQATINKENTILLNGINEENKILLFKLLAQVEENMESVLTTYIIKDAENNG